MISAQANSFQDVTFHLSQIDKFLTTSFDALPSDRDTLLARKTQIESYISDLESIKSDFVERIQRKLGVGFAASLRPGSVQHQTDMEYISSRICSLKFLLNALVPISRLPTEILHHIISFRAGHFIEPFRLSLTSKAAAPLDLLGWIKVTHVCRKWREVALNDPALWSQISPARPRWALEMLSRSRNAPLSFIADYFDLSFKGQEATRTILKQISRVQELSLSVPEPGVLLAELVQPAPNLKSFTMRVYRELRPKELEGPLFQGVAPKLRHMSLDNFKIPWGSPLFRGLTVLRLANLNLHHDVSPAQFLDVFRRIPNLHALRIMEVEVELRNETFTPPQRLVLPNLNYLTLTGSASVCGFILRHVDLPKNPTIYVAFNLRREQIEQTPETIVDSFAPHLSGIERPMRHLVFEGISKSSMRLEGSLTEYNTQLDAPRSHLTFRITTNPDDAMYQIVSQLPAAFLSCLPPLGHLRSVLFKGWGVSTVCCSRVPALASVTSIILQGRAGSEWLSHMNSRLGENALPSLQTIVLTGMAFKHSENSMYHSLTTFLGSKRKECAKIEVLEFRECIGLEKGEVLHLQTLVPEVRNFFME